MVAFLRAIRRGAGFCFNSDRAAIDDKTLLIWEALDGRLGFFEPGLVLEFRTRMIVVKELFPKRDVHSSMENLITLRHEVNDPVCDPFRHSILTGGGVLLGMHDVYLPDMCVVNEVR